VTYKPNPGMTLIAVNAMQTQEQFSRAQVAYIVAVAYEIGRRHTLAEDLAETIGTWDAHATPSQVRDKRKAARLAEYERLAGPARYHGGPVDWETGRPLRSLGVAA
jgi:hypothetical protein